MNKFCNQTVKNINAEIKLLENKKMKLSKLSDKVAAFHKDINAVVKKITGCFSVEVMDLDYYTSCWADSVDDAIRHLHTVHSDSCAISEQVDSILNSEVVVVVRPVENRSKPNLAFVASEKDCEEIVAELTKPLVKKYFKNSDRVRVLFCWSGC